MKTLLTIILLLVPITGFSQGTINGMAKVGAYLPEYQQGAAAYWVGGETPLYQDTSGGFGVYTQNGVFYSNISGDDVQGASTSIIAKRRLATNFGHWYVGFGSGVLIDVKDGDDASWATFRVETGFDIWGQLGIGLACDYLMNKNSVFPQVVIDLSPNL